MAKATLSTNYKDDILHSSAGGKRKYRMVYNDDGTVSLDDVTVYDQEGSDFGAGDINKTNEAVNQSADANKIIDDPDTAEATTKNGYIAGVQLFNHVNNSLGGVSQFIVDETTGKISGYKTEIGGADTVFPFSGGIKNLLHYQFGGTSDGGNRFVQLNYSDLSIETGLIQGGRTVEYRFPNYEYTSSHHYGDIVTNTGGEFIVLYNKGNNMTTNTVQKLTAEAGETIFSKQTGNENFRVIVVKVSSNGGEDLEPLIPIMTSNTTPYGEAFCSTKYSDTYDAWKAFDGVLTTGWNALASDKLNNAHFGYRFIKPVTVKKIGMAFNSTSGSSSFDIMASNDGTEWDKIASINNLPIGNNSFTFYDVDVQGAYTQYKAVMTGGTPSNGNGYSLQFYG